MKYQRDNSKVTVTQEMRDQEQKKKSIPCEHTYNPQKAYRAHTKGKFEDSVAVTSANLYTVDKKWKATANPESD